MSGTLTFFQTFFHKSKSLGAVLPSSKTVVKELLSVLAQDAGKNRRLLEVGAGSGVITEQILNLLRPGDTFDIVELEPEFAKTLKALIEKSGKSAQVTLHMTGIERFQTDKKFTYIFSSLPLTNFDEPLVYAIYEKFKTLLEPQGKMSYYEYFGMSSVRLMCYRIGGMSSDYKRLKGIKTIKRDFLRTADFKEKIIFSNLFPARVCHLENFSIH